MQDQNEDNRHSVDRNFFHTSGDHERHWSLCATVHTGQAPWHEESSRCCLQRHAMCRPVWMLYVLPHLHDVKI